VFAPLATGIFLSPALFPVSGTLIKDGAMIKKRGTTKAQQRRETKNVVDTPAGGTGKRLHAVVSFKDSVPAAELEQKMNELIAEAGETQPTNSRQATIGRVFKLAKAVAIGADEPTIEKLRQSADVNEVTASDIDVFIRPVRPRPRLARRRSSRARKST
jgi:hypothetical protein